MIVLEGKRFYKLASEYREARLLGLNDTLIQLYENYHLAVKPLNYISEHFLEFRETGIFPILTD